VAQGHQVSICNSRPPESLHALCAQIGAQAVSIEEVTQGADIVVLAIPTGAIAQLPKSIFSVLSKHMPVVDTSNYHPQLRDGPIAAIEQGMLESQWVAMQIGHPVIKAFNTILATQLDKGVAKDDSSRIALAIAGDCEEAKALVITLINCLGFNSVDAGSIGDSWRQQTGAPAYCRDLNAAELKIALDQAQKDLITRYRCEREAFIKKSMGA
jgi:8-hydroxy-5-deazaflavin:NADPH oxidoreductase